MHVLIVGSGIGGLTLAQSLRKQGISFEIFERDVDDVIDELVSSLPSDMPDLKESTNHLAPLPSVPSYAITMVAGMTVLASSLPVQWGKHGTRIEHDDKGVAVNFQDGASARGDIVIGADGVYSVVRQRLLQHPSGDLLQVVPLTAIVGELIGDAALAMTPSRSEGEFHAFNDAMKLTAALGRLYADAKFNDIIAVKAAVTEYHDEMLKRGSAAVLSSRSSYQEAKKRSETKQHFTRGIKSLPAEEIVLEVKA